MKLFPETREARRRVALLPFMVYVVAVPFVAGLSCLVSRVAGWDNLGSSWYGAHAILEQERAHRYALLECGYGVSIVALLIGAAALRERRARRLVLALTFIAVALMVLLYPATQVAETRSSSVPNPRPGVDAAMALTCRAGRQQRGATQADC